MEEALPELTLFTICTPYKTHKWEITRQECLLEHDGEWMTPGELLHRFTSDPTNPKVIRAEVCKRLPIRNGIYSYTWQQVIRLV